MQKWLAAIVGALGLSSCGVDESKPFGTLASFPATLEGNLSVDVINDAGSFGTLTTQQSRFLIAIPAPVFVASGASHGGGKVRVTIEAKEAEYAHGVATYRVSQMTKL